MGQYSHEEPVPLLIKLAPGILKNAQAYDALGRAGREDAFVLYTRFVDLVANHIILQPDLRQSKKTYFKDPNGSSSALYKDFQRLLPFLQDSMQRSEAIMAEIKAEYEQWERDERRRKEMIDLQKAKMEELRNKTSLSPAQQQSPLLNRERRKSSMNSDVDYFLSSKLRTLSNASSNNTNYASIDGATMAMDYDTDSELKYPQATDYAIEEDEEDNESDDDQLPTNFKINHKTVNKTEAGSPMRTLFLPHGLESSFLDLAQSNTTNQIETCGILCGKLNRNAFFITHLVIPQQDSTPNTCSTKNEELMFEYIDSEDPDLFILGWIHTHPTQSCFLSSVDLHTQNSYQIMLNEAIAIVCAPKANQKKIGVFRLTDPPGVPTITNCTKSGFHPHEEKNLYVECNRGKDVLSGHVVIKQELPFKVKDLR